MVNLIFSHIIVFILGMVVMAQMFALNQQPLSEGSDLPPADLYGLDRNNASAADCIH